MNPGAQEDAKCCGEPCATRPGKLNRGVFAVARLAGRASRACRDSLGAAGALVARPLRSRELPLSFRASRAIHHAQVRLARWRKETQTLTDRLAERIASNAAAGRADPAGEPDARDRARAIETAKARTAEVESLVETLAGTVALLEARLSASDDEKETAPADKEEPADAGATPVPAVSAEMETLRRAGSTTLCDSAPEADSSTARRPGGKRPTTPRQPSRPKSAEEPQVPPPDDASAPDAGDEAAPVG
jgi:hypothetical protein